MRALPWERRVSTWFGCGDSPIAPGTVGALGALPLHWVLKRLSPGAHMLAVTAVVAAGIWCSDQYARGRGEKDPSSAVIDEVAGTLIALGLVRSRSAGAQLLALGLFRTLDVVKPGPINRAQQASPPGLGIMADDLLAGLAAGLATRWLTRAPH